MAGDPEGDDYRLVTTYHGRPILQCFWCDCHLIVRWMRTPTVLDLNHKAIRHLRRDLDHAQMVSLLLDQEEDAPTAGEAPPEPVEPAIVIGELEPAMLLADAPVVDNTPVVLNPDPDQNNTPIGTEAELVSHIPVTARPLDHDSLILIATQVGWGYTPVRKQPEWMDFELPPPVPMGPLRTKLQGTTNMIKYFRINAGTKEQRRTETLARRQRLVEYRRRMFSDRLEALNAMKTIEYKPEAI